MPHRLAVYLTAATLALVGVASVTVPASAAPVRPVAGAATRPDTGWQRYYAQPFVDPAGDPCAFEVDVTVVRDDEYYRTVSTNPDGSPRIQEFTGPLVLRYVNASTGRAVVRDLSGTALFIYRKNGSLLAPWSGGGGVTVHHGNVGLAAGEWVFDGIWVLTVDPAGNRAVHQVTGHAENLCTTLA